MTTPSDEIFILKGEKLDSLPVLSMRKGLLGKNLEEALQTLLEKYPQIIPGRQIDPVSEDPPRFALLRREISVAGWALDHLFVDQRGTLTLVETKLFQNPQSRREVLGQIIEYAANAKQYWGGGRVRQEANKYWSESKQDIDKVLRDAFGEGINIDDFWFTVEEKLKDGDIRLIITTDELRPEMRRMIEYLNREMQNAEVLGLEIKFYGSESDTVVMVPRLIGQTIQKVPTSGKTEWTVELLRDAYDNMEEGTLRQRLNATLDWAIANKNFMSSIAKSPTMSLRSKQDNRLITFTSDGSIYTVLQETSFLNAESRDIYADKLKGLGLLDSALDLSAVASGKNLKTKLHQLAEEEYGKLLAIFSDYCA